MTIGDANDINTLLHYLYGLPGYTGVPTAQQVQVAAERLAGRANKALGAGLSASAIREAKDRLPQPGKEVDS
jgi:hypothetical protein